MTTIYRAADSTELFIGAHFAETREEALAYTDNPGFGGDSVFEITISGDVLYIDSVREMAQWAVGAGVEPPCYEFENYDGDFEESPGDWSTLHQEWMSGCLDQVFKVIENDDRVLDALNNSAYAWVSFEEPTIGDESGISRTFRYLGE